jgi:hypothetical protein
MAVIEASALAGIVTALNSSHSHLRNRTPKEFLIGSVSVALKPIDSPRTRPALISAHASSMRGRTPLAICALI